MKNNKEADNDWFRLESNKEGTKWFGTVWTFVDQLKYEFDIEFDVRTTCQPSTRVASSAPRLHQPLRLGWLGCSLARWRGAIFSLPPSPTESIWPHTDDAHILRPLADSGHVSHGLSGARPTGARWQDGEDVQVRVDLPAPCARTASGSHNGLEGPCRPPALTTAWKGLAGHPTLCQAPFRTLALLGRSAAASLLLRPHSIRTDAFWRRGGKICLTDHFKPLWARNVPHFGIAHAMALGVSPAGTSAEKRAQKHELGDVEPG